MARAPRVAPRRAVGVQIEPEVSERGLHRVIDRNRMSHRRPLNHSFNKFGGLAGVVRGISLRIAVSIIGHWMTGHSSHQASHRGCWIGGLPVQGCGLPGQDILPCGKN